MRNARRRSYYKLQLAVRQKLESSSMIAASKEMLAMTYKKKTHIVGSTLNGVNRERVGLLVAVLDSSRRSCRQIVCVSRPTDAASIGDSDAMHRG